MEEEPTLAQARFASSRNVRQFVEGESKGAKAGPASARSSENLALRLRRFRH
jgi:hypothetical protein